MKLPVTRSEAWTAEHSAPVGVGAFMVSTIPLAVVPFTSSPAVAQSLLLASIFLLTLVGVAVWVHSPSYVRKARKRLLTSGACHVWARSQWLTFNELAAGSSNCSSESLQSLVGKLEESHYYGPGRAKVIIKAFGNVNCPPDVLRKAVLGDESEQITPTRDRTLREVVLGNPSLPEDVMTAVVFGTSAQDKENICANPALPEKLRLLVNVSLPHDTTIPVTQLSGTKSALCSMCGRFTGGLLSSGGMCRPCKMSMISQSR